MRTLLWSVVYLFVSCVAAGAVTGENEAERLYLGLPRMPLRDEPARIELGRKLFFDKRLSATGTVSCATCHKPEIAFSDGLAVSRGVRGQTGSRNAPSLTNVALNQSFFWDGRRGSLEEQALDPFVNPREHGLANHDQLVSRISRDSVYRTEFHKAFDLGKTPINATHIAQALASYERTLVAANTPFDRHYYVGDRSALSESAVRGLAVFSGSANCVRCHTIDVAHATFTDGKFHRLSVGTRAIEHKLPVLTSRLVAARRSGQSLDTAVINDRDIAELGRFVVTLDPADIGAFRTPSLRNVALTAPYMHDGSVKTLEEAVDIEIYYRGVDRGYPLIVTLQERADLVEFLKALTTPQMTR